MTKPSKAAIQRIEGLTNIYKEIQFLLEEGFEKIDIINYIKWRKF